MHEGSVHAPALTRRDVGSLGVILLITFAAAAVGSLATGASLEEWYPGLERPAWAPPPWLFGPVWLALYGLMAVAAWRVYRDVELEGPDRPLLRYGLQLGLNALWSLLFFGLRRPGWALVEIVVLIAAIVWTLRAFLRHDRWAGLLLLPYLAWVAFAALLNASVWWMNR